VTDNPACRLCGGALAEFADFGQQPMAHAFLRPSEFAGEFFYRLAIGACQDCTMVQLIDEVPNERMFHKEYPYRSSGSAVMRGHFQRAARGFLDQELTGDDPFIVEIGSNDGVMLLRGAAAGRPHLGVEPCDNVVQVAERHGVQVLNRYFDEAAAEEIVARHGPADVIFSANTISHISRLGSVFRGVSALLGQTGIFVFEDPYFLDIVERTSFDQICDEHVYLFTARSVAALAAQHGFELVDAERIPVHGGEVRYTIARAGARPVRAAVPNLMEVEHRAGLTEPGTLRRFAANVARHREELVGLLRGLRDQGRQVAGYGATAKSATAMNYCGIGPDLVSFVCDNNLAKQGLYTPGSHVLVRPPQDFAAARPDYTLLFAWNHSDEVLAKEAWYESSGGHWIRYVPDVRVI
jgi:methylation protein EvaC